MRKTSLLLFLLFTFLGSQGWGAQEQKHYNRLIHEKSPYLLQHAKNPIWWYAWGDEAFEAARRENKPIFLSIGYSTCHWCHVMEGDSFENEEVAKYMNEHFIAVKVDREERPDVDQIYMEILMALRGQGGWPVSMFLSPDRVPFMGATFVPRAEFQKLMEQISQAWKTDPARIKGIGQQVTAWLEQQEDRGFLNAPIPEDDLFEKYLQQTQATFEPEYGGFNKSPKFPQSSRLSLLLRIHKRTGDPKVLEYVTKSLDGMARGAMYDQLGGGFHRYSTDSMWQIPHYEKMLYTNSALAVNYLEAFQVTGNPEYERIARGTLDYVLRDMTHPKGGFYSAEDADSEKTEGKFYVWSMDELKKVLSAEEWKAIVSTYNVTNEGNFNPEERVRALEEAAGMKALEHQNAFYVALDKPLPDHNEPILKQAREKLIKIRNTRIRPGLDDKILTAWNGLMISSMAKAFQVLEDPRYLKAAQNSAEFVLNNLQQDDGKLLRRWRDGSASFNAYLNDYAFLIQGLLTLYQSDFQLKWYQAALKLQGLQDELFWDDKKGGYYFADSSDSSLLQRRITYHDSSLPSGNAVAALNLLQLADLSLTDGFREKAGRVISADGLKMVSYPTNYSQMMVALEYLLDRSKEVAVIGSEDHALTQEVVKMLRQEFLPNQVVAVSTPVDEDAGHAVPLIFNKPMIKATPTTYVCENKICQLPTSDMSKIKTFVHNTKPYSWQNAVSNN